MTENRQPTKPESQPPAEPFPLATPHREASPSRDRNRAGDHSRRTPRRLVWILVASLLALHATLSLTSTLDMSETCDEVAHLTSGYSYWKTGDFRLVPEHPPLAQLWAAIPLLLSQPQLPSLEEPSWRVSDQWGFGKKFLYESGNDADTLLLQSRAMITLLSMVTGLMVFVWSSRLFGTAAGLFSLTLFAFSPTMLANGSLVTTDMACCLLFLLSATGIWSVLQHATPARILLSGLALGGLLLTKMSGVLIVPMAGGMVVVSLLTSRPLRLTLGGRSFEFSSRWERLGVSLALAGMHGVIAFACIWATFGFRYEAMRNADPTVDRLDTFGPDLPYETSWAHELQALGKRGPLVQWVRDHKLLPEAYLYGFAYAVNMTRSRAAFLNGKQTAHGFVAYFPFTVATKTTLGMLAVALAGGLVFLFAKSPPGKPLRRRLLFATAPLWVLVAIYWAFAIPSHLNIGHRHMLPTYPPMFILCGCLVAVVPVAGATSRRRVVSCLAWGLAAIHALSSVTSWPHYISFFNELIGGPSNAYRHVVDSSLDWGQDLARLSKRLNEIASETGSAENKTTPTVYLAYLCNTPPEYYGIKAVNLRSRSGEPPPAIRLGAGIYCISATRLQQVYDVPISRWTPFLEEAYQSGIARIREVQGLPPTADDTPETDDPASDGLFMRLRFARLCATLRERNPDDRAGYSILIYHVSEAEIDQALFGPPPELEPDTPEGTCELALNLVRAGDADRAAKLLEWATEHDADYANARHWLGYARHRQGRRQEAIDHYVEALTLDGATPGAYTNLGLCLAQLGRVSEAIKMYRTAIRHEPLVPETHFNLGKALAAAGQCPEAISMCRRAVELRPADPALRAGLREVLVECGQLDGRGSGRETLAPAALASRILPETAPRCCDH